MAVEYGKFNRLVGRAAEIAGANGAAPVLVTVYQQSAQVPFSRFAAAHAAVDDAQTRYDQASKGLAERHEEMARHSNIALAAITAISPETKLPGPLKSQSTDTDRRQMLERVLVLLNGHTGEPWADTLLQGDFGTQAAQYVQLLNDAIEAANDLQAAKSERSDSFEPAWRAFVAYKWLVRSFYGRAARQYRRLKVRVVTSDDDSDEESEEEDDDEAEAETPPEEADDEVIPGPAEPGDSSSPEAASATQ